MPYPVFLNLNGRKCVIVGGGPVAERRAESLLAQDCKISIIAPEATRRIAEWSAGEACVYWTKSLFEPGALDGAFLAIAATNDPGVNQAVAAAARERGILLCRADDSDAGDFTTPAVLERGALIIALSTGGASPTLAAVLLARLKSIFGPEWGAMTELFRRLRPDIQAVPSDEQRKTAVNRILDNQAVQEQVRSGNQDAAVAEAMRCI